ncbi:MAG: orotate phosphoribosyltransferase [Clostridiales bacterium]|nr:orotate phosphoribosyltransferase [Clostridiales bacterium]MCI7703780.1 orotate phosphoribosyltransferase [Clostridiales bacterium]MDY3764628.1 orotate phosphoribosyltransferase [Candidatus Ventricola sp.]
MENPIISWLFETDAVRVCPEGQPFWYTSGKLGPFYINTQFLYGSEAAANSLLKTIEEACAGEKLAFYDKVWADISAQLASCPIYAQLIDLLTEAAAKLDVDFVSGGERRDFFFSMPVARKLGLGHLSIFKDLSCVYTDKDGVSMDAAQAGLAGKKSVHIADLITVASSYIRAWIPAVESLGARIAYSLAVVDRDQGGSDILAKAGCPLTTLVTIKPELFEQAKALGRVTDAQVALVNSFIADPDKFMHDFLVAHPDFLASEIAKGGKSAQRAELCIASGFAPAEALPKA